MFALRTCNAFWNGPVYIREPKDIEPMLEGMASQLTEREDFIIRGSERICESINVTINKQVGLNMVPYRCLDLLSSAGET